MPRVRFDGPGRLVVFGHTLGANEVAEMSEAEAAELEAHPHIKVTVLGVRRHGAAPAGKSPAKKSRKTTKQEE